MLGVAAVYAVPAGDRRCDWRRTMSDRSKVDMRQAANDGRHAFHSSVKGVLPWRLSRAPTRHVRFSPSKITCPPDPLRTYRTHTHATLTHSTYVAARAPAMARA